MRLDDDPIYRSLKRIRGGAIAAGHTELALQIGWSMIRRGNEIILEQCVQLRATAARIAQR